MTFAIFGSRWINTDTVCSVCIKKSKKPGWRVTIKTTSQKNPYIISHRYDTIYEAKLRMFEFVSCLSIRYIQ